MIGRMDGTWDELEARLFQTLASPVRLRILELLRASGSMTVGEIYQRLGLAPANASQHLGVLRAQGLVIRRRAGTSMHYSIAERALYHLLDGARALCERQIAGHVRLIEGPGPGTQKRRDALHARQPA